MPEYENWADDKKVIDALYDLREKDRQDPQQVDKLDKNAIMSKSEDSDFYNRDYTKKPINLAVSENLRLALDLDVGDLTTLCIKKSRHSPCEISRKVRIVAYLNSMPGIYEISQLNIQFSMSPVDFKIQDDPAVIIPQEDYLDLMRTGRGNQNLDENSLPVSKVILNIDQDMDYTKRMQLRNQLITFHNDLNVFQADSSLFEEILKKRFVLADVF